MSLEGVRELAKYSLYIGAAVAIYPVIKNNLSLRYKRGRYDETRTAIVTGASNNLGAAISYELARHRARVIMACRDMEKCAIVRRQVVLASRNRSVACRHLDLEDVGSINKFVDEMKRTEPHIDILINNAEVKKEKKEMTKYGVEKTFWINFVAPYLLTIRLMDQLKESSEITRDSRIVNLVMNPRPHWSVDLDDINFEKRPYKPDAAYNQSKLALAYFTILLDKLTKEQTIPVYVFGASSVFKDFNDPFRKHAGGFDYFKYLYECYTLYEVMLYSAPLVKCAIDDQVIKKKHRGSLYGIGGYGWSWPKVTQDDNKAKLVWNYAANLLINLPNNTQPKSKTQFQRTSDTQTAKKVGNEIETIKASNLDKSIKANKGIRPDGGESISEEVKNNK